MAKDKYHAYQAWLRRVVKRCKNGWTYQAAFYAGWRAAMRSEKKVKR